jgi:hypothetical protein
MRGSVLPLVLLALLAAGPFVFADQEAAGTCSADPGACSATSDDVGDQVNEFEDPVHDAPQLLDLTHTVQPGMPVYANDDGLGSEFKVCAIQAYGSEPQLAALP